MLKKNLTEMQLQLVREEIAILATFDHPNIVRYVESYEDVRYMYIVMECIEDATSLQSLIENRVKETVYSNEPLLLEAEVCRLMYMMLRGIQHIHENGIVHRDLKPDNCLVDKNLQLKIIDFGLSRNSKYYSTFKLT